MGHQQSTTTRTTSIKTTNSRSITKLESSQEAHFSKYGSQLNVKILAMGSRKVGKSSLIARLEGKSFNDTYTPTAELQVSHVRWRPAYVREEMVKMECWDVVDKAFLDPDAYAGKNKLCLLDASVVDVYQGCNGVIMMYDPRSKETIEDAIQKCQSIPLHIGVLLLGNFLDVWEKDNPPNEILSLVDALRSKGMKAFHLEISTKTCKGLKSLYHFLNLPFLQAKETMLQQQLASCRESLTACEKNVLNDSYKETQIAVQMSSDPEHKALEDFLKDDASFNKRISPRR